MKRYWGLLSFHRVAGLYWDIWGVMWTAYTIFLWIMISWCLSSSSRENLTISEQNFSPISMTSKSTMRDMFSFSLKAKWDLHISHHIHTVLSLKSSQAFTQWSPSPSLLTISKTVWWQALSYSNKFSTLWNYLGTCIWGLLRDGRKVSFWWAFWSKSKVDFWHFLNVSHWNRCNNDMIRNSSAIKKVNSKLVLLQQIFHTISARGSLRILSIWSPVTK